MHKLFSLLILMVTLLLITQGCLAEEKGAIEENVADFPPQLTANESVSNLTATIGDTILISLNENPTTGYTWNITNSSGLELIDDSYEMEKVKEGILGAGGVHSWMVRAIETGNQSFSGVYKHSWEPDSKDDQTYKLIVFVR